MVHAQIGEGDFPQQLVTFPVIFPIDFACGKLAGKVAYGDHVAMGHCNCRKCNLDAKHPNHNHITVEALQQLEFQGPVSSFTHLSLPQF